MGGIGAEGTDRSRTTFRQSLHGIARGSGRRSQRLGRPRLLRVECLEDRTLLSIAAGGAEKVGFPVTQVAVAPLATNVATGSVAARPDGLAAVSLADPTSIDPGLAVSAPSPASAAASSTVSVAALDVAESIGGSGPVILGAAARPNLTPYKPATWSDKIVVSNVTGTHTGSALSTTDTLYVDWTGLNNGGAATSTRFYIELYVDGAIRNTWYFDPPLYRYYYAYAEDFSIGQLSAGQHTIRVKLDSTRAVAESNEYDNAYTKTITVTRPNLTPYKPAGWGDKIVVSNVTGTHAGSTLYSNNTLYVDWAGLNHGKVPTAAQFYIELYVDGSLQNTWFFDPPLNRNYYTHAQDFAIGPLSAGRHTVQVKLDTTQAVAEANEKDNVYTRSITVLPPVMKSNLTPYQPTDWSDRIVVSTATGTHADSSTLLASDTLYIDWAGINNGNAATARQFTSRLYVDGTLKQTFNTPAPLDANSYAFIEDYAIGPLSAGRHTIQIRLDTGNTIAEINENDNVYTRSITVTSGTSIAFVVHYTDSAGEGFFDPQLGVQRRSAFEYALGIWSGLLSKAYEGETVTVDAAMDPLAGGATWAVLGQAGPKNLRWNFGGNGLPNTVYGDALANHLAGRDLSPGVAEISAQFNSNVDNQTVLGSTDWYYGTDGNPSGDIDFVSVLLHEVGHGLNFFDLIDDGTGGWAVAGYPGAYDRFLERGDGTDLTGMTNAGRKSAIVSNDLYWNGSDGMSGNGGTRPTMYAPNPYEGGSSVAHTDETVHKYDLMSPMYSGPDHTPGPVDLGILADMGWNLRSAVSSAMLLTPETGEISESPQWAPFGALIQEQYVLPSSLSAAASSGPAGQSTTLNSTAGAGASRDWLGAVDWVLSSLHPGSQAELGQEEELDRGRGAFEQVAAWAALEPRETLFHRKAAGDRAVAKPSPSRLASDLASDLPAPSLGARPNALGAGLPTPPKSGPTGLPPSA